MGWCAVHTHFGYAQCELGNHTILVRNTYFCFNCVNSEGSMRKHNQIYVSNGRSLKSLFKITYAQKCMASYGEILAS